MHPVLLKTFGGLSRAYYFRNFVFGLIFPAFFIFIKSQSGSGELSGDSGLPFTFIGVMVISSFLYPYARFVYESIVGFIMGENVFFVNAGFMLVVKMLTMFLCWGFSIFIAPLGLAWLYYHHTKAGDTQ
ncbi:hypothetical protein AGMMS50225_16790 [Betaproteobacteria bacterium]|nr:hypothetical protein AGMMS50225_16790 [Betaproteobacteria bacterium]